MESQGDINNNEDLLNILWNDNSNIPLQFPSWSEDQGQQIDPDSMQNNAFARNPAPSPALGVGITPAPDEPAVVACRLMTLLTMLS